MSGWKTYHYLCYIILAVLVFEPSYIHPDEHFQCLEVLSNRFYGYSANIPWEFTDMPSRSLAVLYLVYGPLLSINKVLKFKPLALLYLCRAQLAISYVFVTHFCTRILAGTRKDASKSIFFIYGSYITWTYQSHTFSNSVETQLLLIALTIIHLIRTAEREDKFLSFALGLIAALGVFNRITFGAFLLIPCSILLNHFLRYPRAIIICILSFASVSYILVLFDSRLFHSSRFVIVPLNNFLYNINQENLALHGIHPRYTHLLLNLPQLIGPLIFIDPRSIRFTSTTGLSFLSGMIILSVMPHQELRFLIPLIPLYSTSIDLGKKQRLHWIVKTWCVFNLVLGAVMGGLHQRGVIVALDHLRDIEYHGVQIWWKTYTPPTWILGSHNLRILQKGKFDNLERNENALVDLMGADISELKDALERAGSSLLITPRSSVPILESLDSSFDVKKVWSYSYHLDFDHFDTGDIRTFYPGIDAYNITTVHSNK